MGRTAAHDSVRLHCRGNCLDRFGLLPVAILMRSGRFFSSRTIRSMRSRATSGPDSSESAAVGDGTRTLWRPLRTPLFRNLLIADVMSDIGTFMQTVGAAWLMVSLGAGPMYVALTQTASALPFFVFALPAGSIGDIVDRRRLILYTEFWMVGVATVLAVATIFGFMSPWLLLLLTFALSAGDAMETPTWRAVLPEMVEKDDLTAASTYVYGSSRWRIATAGWINARAVCEAADRGARQAARRRQGRTPRAATRGTSPRWRRDSPPAAQVARPQTATAVSPACQ
jgi:hypothetical protein